MVRPWKAKKKAATSAVASPAKKLPKAAPIPAAAVARVAACVCSHDVAMLIHWSSCAWLIPNGSVPSQATSDENPAVVCSTSVGNSLATCWPTNPSSPATTSTSSRRAASAASAGGQPQRLSCSATGYSMAVNRIATASGTVSWEK